jgi:hypothetical protein
VSRGTHLTGAARHDDRLGDALAPPTEQEAEEALSYWRQRLAGLPVHRRGDRREAREMLARWQQRLHEGRRRERSERALERLLGPLADRLPSPRALLALGTTLALVLAVVLVVALIALAAFWRDMEPVVDDLVRLTEGGG